MATTPTQTRADSMTVNYHLSGETQVTVTDLREYAEGKDLWRLQIVSPGFGPEITFLGTPLQIERLIAQAGEAFSQAAQAAF